MNLNIPSMHGCLCLVTGANSGIGFAITKRLAASGADVIMAVRNIDKGYQTKAHIEREIQDASLFIELLDLSSLESVHKFAERMLKQSRPISILINNAGLMTASNRIATPEAFELHFIANYLGHFALTARLMPLLTASGVSRVTMMSSSTSRYGKINFDDLQHAESFSAKRAYAQSKLAMLMFALELNHRTRQSGWPIISNAAHPGAARTNIQASLDNVDKAKARPSLVQHLLMKVPGIWQDADDGALPVLLAATNDQCTGGEYYGPGGMFELRGPPKRAKIPTRATIAADRNRLWILSEKLAQVKFPWGA